MDIDFCGLYGGFVSFRLQPEKTRMNTQAMFRHEALSLLGIEHLYSGLLEFGIGIMRQASAGFLYFLILGVTAHAEFRASAVKIDITPKSPQWLMGYGARQSTGVHDPIFHRIAALD